MSLWIVGLELKSFLEKFYEFVKSPLHSAESCQISIDNVIACACCDQFSVNRFCFLKFDLIDQCKSLLLLVGVICRALGGLFS